MKGYRKFAVALVAIVTTSILVSVRAIDQGSYTAVMTVIVGGFMTANVAQGAVASKAAAQ